MFVPGGCYSHSTTCTRPRTTTTPTTAATLASITPIVNTPTIFPLLLKLKLCLRIVVVTPQLVQGQERPCATHSCAAVNQDGSRFVRLDLESSNRVLARNNFQKQEKETYMQLLHLLHHVHQLPAKFILSRIFKYP